MQCVLKLLLHLVKGSLSEELCHQLTLCCCITVPFLLHGASTKIQNLSDFIAPAVITHHYCLVSKHRVLKYQHKFLSWIASHYTLTSQSLYPECFPMYFLICNHGLRGLSLKYLFSKEKGWKEFIYLTICSGSMSQNSVFTLFISITNVPVTSTIFFVLRQFCGLSLYLCK